METAGGKSKQKKKKEISDGNCGRKNQAEKREGNVL